MRSLLLFVFTLFLVAGCASKASRLETELQEARAKVDRILKEEGKGKDGGEKVRMIEIPYPKSSSGKR